jgi:thiamine kinase-like enzyme
LVAEQYVFGRHDDAYWSRYLATLDRTVDVLHSGTCSWDAELAKVARERMWVTKTGDRLANVAACWPELSGAIRINGVDVPGLSQVQAELAGVVAASRLCVDRPITRIHGDLHGGNMLYEHRTNTLKMIDPRGSFGVAGGYGDPVYDLAKLAHGFIGRYDSIVFDCYEVAGGFGSYSLTFIEVGTGHAVLAQQFRSWLSERAGSDPYQVTMRDVDLGNALMFLSLAALHGDDSNRQLAFLLRGLQLWGEAVTTPPPAK